ncbi:MAG TPA: nuclear transport factor 2 family protein [Pyrinomonadaceae bacterium]|nr:nuclear transport factor 2 family protein [Pyrinomonadaceae bacterium]
MKKLVLLTFILLVNFAIVTAQNKKVEVVVSPQKKVRVSQAKNPAEKELEDLEYKLSDALVSKDETVLKELIADDFTIAGSSITKKSYIEIAKTPQLNFNSVEKSEMRIRIYGETAVISGRTNTSRKIENGESSSVFNFMDVWVKSKSGGWQCVAMSQDSVLLIFSYK